MAFVSYKVENDNAFQKLIDSAFKETRDLRIPFRQIVRVFYQSRKAIFKLKSAGAYPDFKGPKVQDTWKNPGRPDLRTREGELTSYQNVKLKRHGFIYPLLKATGKLESSITDPNDSNAKQEIDATSLTIITNIPYSNYHQQDNPDMGDRTMPTRKFFFIGGETRRSSRDIERYTKIINDHIVKVLKARL